MRRAQGRVTRDDIRSAGLRRWDGRARITSDWINIFHEPELCWPTGDIVVYLREPGQSSRGPAFRVHASMLKAKGLDLLLDKCLTRNTIHIGTQCVLPNCPGCDPQATLQELYMPAPHSSGLEATFNHHVTTRNLFAWMYNRPLVGRTLGKALIELKERIDIYRPDVEAQNRLEVISYAESQKYLDFRECVDHALAALYLAEQLQIEDLWVDAFAHCVGLSHRGLRSSIEYAPLSAKSKTLINRARLEMDVRLNRVNGSISNFFEKDLSENFLGLPQASRDHLNRFRAFLKAHYADQAGSWPPVDFEMEAVQKAVHYGMLHDFRNLYQYLVDPQSSTVLTENIIPSIGGLCILQNIQAFDSQHKFEPLTNPLPLLPAVLEFDTPQRPKNLTRRLSWNPIQKRKAEKEARKVRERRSLITHSNSDVALMDSLLVRRFAEFEQQTVDDELVGVSLVEGRKVRWILIYAVLQTLSSITDSPKQVRNTSDLTYSLCCQVPKQMPWHVSASRTADSYITGSDCIFEPDTLYSHTYVLRSDTEESIGRGRSLKARRLTLPSTLAESLSASLLSKTPPGSRSTSLRRLMSRKLIPEESVPKLPQSKKRASFCPIYVEGYGNGLDGARIPHVSSAPNLPAAAELTAVPLEPTELDTEDLVHELDANAAEPVTPPMVEAPCTPPAISRESSTASGSRKSYSSASDAHPATPAAGDDAYSLKEILKPSVKSPQALKDEKRAQPLTSEQLANLTMLSKNSGETMPSVHMNTETWDKVLGQEVSAQA